ncbi:Maf family protein [Candidatus Contubernalis alkaliaceticus]|uniref:Maf family protein n=1 Tax=Candidatus Contubernalis alkaliaceticus TaxID=338645 RepID=UPI001F4BDF1F|nr:Maf family protein [Candidatus Contubernalis alkalaceticus]UNC90917.1 septum formation inhibitor Maf [Candidatus Contubernalis alkalaceticus]
MSQLILASASPRRASLLKQVGLEFQVIPSNFIEDNTLQMTKHMLTVFFARSKAEEVASRVNDGIIIGADTVVVSEHEFLGKPGSAEEAFVMLKKLSGTSHQVTTGLAVLDKKSEVIRTLYSTTNVWFRKLKDEEINSYIKTGDPLDKAGAYGIQGKAALFVKRIEGCYFNVVGLPLSELAGILTEFGIKIF